MSSSPISRLACSAFLYLKACYRILSQAPTSCSFCSIPSIKQAWLFGQGKLTSSMPCCTRRMPYSVSELCVTASHTREEEKQCGVQHSDMKDNVRSPSRSMPVLFVVCQIKRFAVPRLTGHNFVCVNLEHGRLCVCSSRSCAEIKIQVSVFPFVPVFIKAKVKQPETGTLTHCIWIWVFDASWFWCRLSSSSVHPPSQNKWPIVWHGYQMLKQAPFYMALSYWLKCIFFSHSVNI